MYSIKQILDDLRFFKTVLLISTALFFFNKLHRRLLTFSKKKSIIGCSKIGKSFSQMDSGKISTLQYMFSKLLFEILHS